MARSSAGKYSVPLRSKVMRLPDVNRFTASSARPHPDAFELECRGERGVIGQPSRHRVSVMDVGIGYREPARIDAVKPEHRQHCRKGPRWSATRCFEYFNGAELLI